MKKMLFVVAFVSFLLTISGNPFQKDARQLASPKKGFDETIREESLTDSVIVTAFNDRAYDFNDFSEIKARKVEDLSIDTPIEANGTKRKMYKVVLDGFGKDKIREAINVLNKRGDLLSAEPNFRGSKYLTASNDIFSAQDWYFNKIDLPTAWDISTGSSAVKIGVMDTGILGTHVDLQNRVDRSESVSYSPNSSDPFSPEYDHGTYVAGIIGAQGNNGRCICGVNWNCSLVSLRVDGPRDGVPASGGFPEREPYEEDMAAVISALNYATAHSIRIINFSGGFSYDTTALSQAVQNYPGLLVCAAGNSHVDLGSSASKVYPAVYSYPNVLTVGGTTINDTVSLYSNYGRNDVDLFAPGENVMGCGLRDNLIIDGTGTSAAAPLVTGVAGLLLSVNRGLTTAQLKSAILSNVDPASSLNGYCVTGGRLNAFKALRSVLLNFTASSSPLHFNYYVPSSQPFWGSFIADPGIYRFQSFGVGNTSISFYADACTNSLYLPPKSVLNRTNFDVTFDMINLRKIYFRIQNDGTSFFFLTWNITSTHTHSFTSSFSWSNSKSHKAFCECGDFIECPHSIAIGSIPHNGYFICTECGGKADRGFSV